MHLRSLRALLLLAFVLAMADHACAQVTLTGMVADSATMQPMLDVNITIKRSGKGTVSDARGYFSLDANGTDTLIFSRVGYYTKVRPVKWVKEVVIIFLTEEHKTLQPVVIESETLMPWLKKLPPESPWKNPTLNKSFTETPGFQGLQTFGPGYVMSGPISRFSKYEKERKKLKVVQRENYKARNYVDIVNDPEVKDKIIKDYNLTEEEYYRLLAIFNEKNKDIIYELQSSELIPLLFMFYGENSKKGVRSK